MRPRAWIPPVGSGTPGTTCKSLLQPEESAGGRQREEGATNDFFGFCFRDDAVVHRDQAERRIFHWAPLPFSTALCWSIEESGWWSLRGGICVPLKNIWSPKLSEWKVKHRVCMHRLSAEIFVRAVARGDAAMYKISARWRHRFARGFAPRGVTLTLTGTLAGSERYQALRG